MLSDAEIMDYVGKVYNDVDLAFKTSVKKHFPSNAGFESLLAFMLEFNAAFTSSRFLALSAFANREFKEERLKELVNFQVKMIEGMLVAGIKVHLKKD